MVAERGGDRLGEWPTVKPELIVKHLCANCNNGWMSRLEGETKPIATSLLDDMLEALDSTIQAILAVWAVKTAMVLEAVYPARPWFYTDSEREHMRLTRAIPPLTEVWVAKCIDQPNLFSVANDLWSDDSGLGVRARLTTMAFGALAVQVLTLRPPSDNPETTHLTYDTSDGPWANVLVPVWPINSIPHAWPPPVGLRSENGIETLATRLRPAIDDLGGAA
jgi:hypothetical protein